MTVLCVALVIVGFAFGSVLGLVIGARHIELETERGYLHGHVDGYRKALDDAGEVPL